MTTSTARQATPAGAPVPQFHPVGIVADLWPQFCDLMRFGGLQLDRRVGPRPLWVVQQSVRAAAAGAPVPELTDRERQILAGIAAGQRNAAIAAELYLSEDTVKSHARRIFRKLGARDRAHAVSLAYQLGVLQLAGDSAV